MLHWFSLYTIISTELNIVAGIGIAAAICGIFTELSYVVKRKNRASVLTIVLFALQIIAAWMLGFLTIAPTVMIDDDISYVNWRGRFQQLGQWFDKEAAVEKWLADYDAKAAELAARIRDMIGDETFAVLEANSVHFGSYYIYRSGGPGELVYDELKLTPSAGVPENVWGEVVDAEYFSLIDADHIFFFSDDGRAGDTGNLAVWKNMKAVKAGNVYFGINEDQYNMAFTAMGKELYLEKLANAILNHGDVE